jgi:hypothetical protein
MFSDQMKFARRTALFFAVLYLLYNFSLPLLCTVGCPRYWQTVLVFSLVGSVCGLLGWLAGTLMTPLGNQEAAAAKVVAAISLIWTTAIAVHIKDIGKWAAVNLAQITPTHERQALFGLGLFILGLTVTFNTRIHGASPLNWR